MNYISLGYFCSVAMELERLGLRKESSPFDWLISDFEGVIKAIENNFEDFLEYDFLSQNSKSREKYRNEKYMFHFFHDFDKYTSLEKQLPSVKEKYSRRITRFYDTISEPTLFVRYISDRESENGKSRELIWIEENYEWIMEVLKERNPQNDILFIANAGVISDKIKIYNVEKDEKDVVARRPFEKSGELKKIFSDIEYENRDINIARYLQKENDKKKITKRVGKECKKIIRKVFLKEYIHDKHY